MTEREEKQMSTEQPKQFNATALMGEAARGAKEILGELATQRPADVQKLDALAQAGRVQFNLAILDVLGGQPRFDLVAITAEGEMILGSKFLNRPKPDAA